MKTTRRGMALKALRSIGATASASSAHPGASKPQAGEELTRYVADWVVKTSYTDIPGEVIELGRKSILDGLGLALVGSVVETGKPSQDYLATLGLSRPDATVIGTSMKVPARFAAFANGIGIHSEDYDDTELLGVIHVTVDTLSAGLAVAEAKGMSGRGLTLAYHLGVEVESKIADAINRRHFADGFHSTGTCGVFGAAVTAAKLHGLDQKCVAWAMGIAGAESGGLRENFGTMTKPLQAGGYAAESGVEAADLAALGWTAAENILEAPRGFFHAAGGGYDSNLIFQKLGNPWSFSSPGVAIKPFPCGALNHPGMSAMLHLIRAHNITAGQVDEVTVGTNRSIPNVLLHHHPTSSLEGKFSMEFCLASLLLYGKAGLNQFTDEVVNRPEVQGMIKRVHMVVDPKAEAAGEDKLRTIVTIRLHDGQVYSETADFAKGSPEDPMTFDEVVAKFEDCAEFAKWPRDKTQSIIAAVRNLENLPDVRVLTALCAS